MRSIKLTIFLASMILGMAVAHGQSLFNSMIQPVVDRCPQFISGDAEIEVETSYAQFEAGRVRYSVRCYIPEKNKSARDGSTVSEGGGKTASCDEAVCQDSRQDENACSASGSIIIPGARVVGDEIPLAGVPFALYYMSDRVVGRTAQYNLKIPLSDSNSGVIGYKIDLAYAGHTVSQTYSNLPDQKYQFVWDGLDSFGNLVVGTALADLTVTLTYQVSPTVTKEIPIKYNSVFLGGFKAAYLGFGGWSPSIMHFYDTNTQLLHRGDGTARKAPAKVLSDGKLMVAAEDASEVYIFDSEGRHLFTKFGLTGENKYEFTYQSTDQHKLEQILMPYGQVIQFTPDSNGRITTITPPKGSNIQLEYDGSGNLSAVRDQLGNTHRMKYAAGGLLTEFKKPEGQTNIFTYTENGSLYRDFHSSGASYTLDETLGSGKRIVTMTSREGKTSTYDIQNTLENVAESNSRNTDSNGRETSIRNNALNLVVFKPDYYVAKGFGKDLRFPESARYATYEEVNINGRGLATTNHRSVNLSDPEDPFSISSLNYKSTTANKASTSIYDGPNRQWTFTSPEGRQSTLKFNEFEKPSEIRVGNLAPTNYFYNEDGLLGKWSQGQREFELQYDANGYLKYTVDPFKKVTRFERDSLGNLLRMTFPDGREVRYKYDHNNNLTDVTPPSRPTHSFLLNAFEGIKKYLPPSLGGIAVTEYAYNHDKQLTRVRRPDGQIIGYSYSSVSESPIATIAPDRTLTFTYDSAADRIATYSSTDGVSGAFTYSGPLRKTEVQNISGIIAELTWNYNDEHQIIQTKVKDGLNNISSSSFLYDKDGLLVRSGGVSYSRHSDLGLITEMKMGEALVRYSYDSTYGNLAKIEFLVGKKTKNISEYERDKLGRILIERSGASERRYQYDSSGRVIGRQSRLNAIPEYQYFYDDNGNRIKATTPDAVVTATYDDQDRVTQWGNTEYSYNANGDLISKLNTSTSETTNYVYDVFGNLKQVSLPGGDVVTYQADALNRRVIRKLNGTVTSRYLYEDNLRIAAEIDASGNLIKRFLYGDHLNVPDYMEFEGEKYLFVKDIRGSIQFVVSSGGQVVQVLQYDDWGKVIADSNPGFQPFGFAGGLYDSDTKLVRFGARDYDTETGRWTSKDPIGFNGGDVNLYGYVINDPINLVDPSGLFGLRTPNIPRPPQPSIPINSEGSTGGVHGPRDPNDPIQPDERGPPNIDIDRKFPNPDPYRRKERIDGGGVRGDVGSDQTSC